MGVSSRADVAEDGRGGAEAAAALGRDNRHAEPRAPADRPDAGIVRLDVEALSACAGYPAVTAGPGGRFVMRQWRGLQPISSIYSYYRTKSSISHCGQRWFGEPVSRKIPN
tara:strand:- start:3251 stop:3583 length:333 start_codon:yes stop_codon:yes gene_type:complete